MPFFHYQLRTIDDAAARTFYAAVLKNQDLDIATLHEQARSRGARPHWLGYLEVTDVEAQAARFVERGATRLGPSFLTPQGRAAAVLRDPGGAVVALAKTAPAMKEEAAEPARPDIAWHELNTVDVERAKANYGELLGWDFKDPFELEGLGVFHPFAWQTGGPVVGSMCDISGRPGVHAHWIFHLRVPALDPAVVAVRGGGGTVIGPITLPRGDRVAICDDPQGAAFALFQARN